MIAKRREAEVTENIVLTIRIDETVKTEKEVNLIRETRVEVEDEAEAKVSTTIRKMIVNVTAIEKMVSDITSDLILRD